MPWDYYNNREIPASEYDAYLAAAPKVGPTASIMEVAPATLPAPSVASSSSSARPSTVNDLYQTFYGTPGDPGGLSYWGGADKAITPKDAASWLLWAGKDPSIANKSTGLTVDQAYETYLGFKPDETARNYWTGGNPNKPLTTAELAAITSEAYGLNDSGGGLFGGGGFLGTGINWTDIRDPLEAAGVVAGNYLLPGSSLLTSQLVSEGAKEQLNTDLGKIANISAGVTGGIQGNAANYGKIAEAAGVTGGTSSLTAEQLAAANATSDPIAAANAIKGWTIADIPYLQSIGATADLISIAEANNAKLLSPTGGGPNGGTVTSPIDTATTSTNLSPTQIANLAKTGLAAAGLLGGAKAVSNLTGGTGNLSLNPQSRAGIFSGSANYSPEYYQAIQSKYNQLMPNQPRDVTTELKNWYETKFAPKVA